jgi:hypothetical protein
MLGMLGSNKINSNFNVNQMKNVVRDLTKQLGEMERGAGTKQEIRDKMLDLAHYNSLLYEMLSFDEYAEFDEELCNIRNA